MTSKYRLAAGAVVAILALSAWAQPAAAGYFQYTTTVTILNGYIPPGSIISPGPTAPAVNMQTPGGVDILISGFSSNSPGDNIDATGPGSDIVFGSIAVAGLTNTSPLEDVFIPYVWHIVIDDYPTFDSMGVLGSTTFDITGAITGTVGKLGGGKQVNLSNNVYIPPIIPPELVGFFELYTIALNSYVPPGPFFPGAFGAKVSSITIPEPSTVVLLGFGILALATPAVRRLRGIARR